MAPHGKELTTEQKEIILFFSNEGFSSYEIQNMTHQKLNNPESFEADERKRKH